MKQKWILWTVRHEITGKKLGEVPALDIDTALFGARVLHGRPVTVDNLEWLNRQ